MDQNGRITEVEMRAFIMEEREWAKIWGIAKVSLWVVQLSCSVGEELERHSEKPRKVSLKNGMRFWMLPKLFGLYEASTEDSVWMFEPEIHHQKHPSGSLIWKEYVGCFGMRKVEGKYLGRCITNKVKYSEQSDWGESNVEINWARGIAVELRLGARKGKKHRWTGGK